MELCSYGCGQESTHVLKNGKNCCSKFSSSCPQLKLKNSLSTKAKYDSGDRKSQKQVYLDLPQDKKDAMNWSKGKILNTPEELFCINDFSTGYIKKSLIELSIREYKCEHCLLTKWNDQFITLELDHIDGNNKNNTLTNLRLLCPNCHSQTDTWRGRNMNTGTTKVSDADLVDALKSEKNIRQALIKVGLTPKGANYFRAKQLKEKHKETPTP